MTDYTSNLQKSVAEDMKVRYEDPCFRADAWIG